MKHWFHHWSWKRYQQPFDDWDGRKETDSIIAQYPRNIIEWTAEEKRLMELTKKAGSKR